MYVNRQKSCWQQIDQEINDWIDGMYEHVTNKLAFKERVYYIDLSVWCRVCCHEGLSKIVDGI